LNNLKLKSNIIVWVARKTDDDYYHIKLEYGNHFDVDLNTQMNEGLKTLPPEGYFLISPHLSKSKLIATFGKRLLMNIYNPLLLLDVFISNQIDALIPPQKIREAIKKFLILVPELAELKEGRIEFKKKSRY